MINMISTMMELIPVVILVAYLSLSLGVMIKLMMYGVRGPHLFLSVLTPLGFVILITASAVKYGKKIPTFKYKMYFYWECLRTMPWLLPTTVAILAKDLTSNKFIISVPHLYDDIFNDRLLNVRGMKML